MYFTEHIRHFLRTLFREEPRQVGLPYRLDDKKTHDQIIKIAMREHLHHPIFVSLYEKTVDKLWIDFDSKSERRVFGEAKTAYLRLLDLGVSPTDIILVYSGNKGFHLYVRNEARDDISPQEIEVVLNYITLGLTTVDRPLFGDMNRLVRIAGVQRPNGLFSVAMNPAEVFEEKTIYRYFDRFDYNYTHIFSHNTDYLRRLNGKRQNYISSILEVAEADSEFMKQLVLHRREEEIPVVVDESPNPSETYFDAVMAVIRTCVSPETARRIAIPNPDHRTRIRVAVALMRKGFTPEDVTDFFRALNWIDFDYEKTLWYAQDLKKRYV